MEPCELIRSHYEEALVKYNKLSAPKLINNIWYIDGGIDIIDVNGYCWDTYSVKIVFPPDYPQEIPRLIETSGKIKRTHDWSWHVNIKGFCCLAPDAMQYQGLAGGINLLKWLDKFVVPFFANHIYRLEFNKYANGEFSHGIKGIIEYYSEVFNLTKLEDIIYRLKLMAGMRVQSQNSFCFCGSSKLYKHCYAKRKEDHLAGIPRSVILDDIKQLEDRGRG